MKSELRVCDAQRAGDLIKDKRAGSDGGLGGVPDPGLKSGGHRSRVFQPTTVEKSGVARRVPGLARKGAHAHSSPGQRQGPRDRDLHIGPPGVEYPTGRAGNRFPKLRQARRRRTPQRSISYIKRIEGQRQFWQALQRVPIVGGKSVAIQVPPGFGDQRGGHILAEVTPREPREQFFVDAWPAGGLTVVQEYVGRKTRTEILRMCQP